MLKKMMIFSVLLLFGIDSVMAEGYEVQVVDGKISGGHVSSVFFKKLVSHYQCYGYAANCWEFISANVDSSFYWVAFHTSSMTQAEAVKVLYLDAPELFPTKLSGEIIPKCPGNGPPPPIDYTITMKGALYEVRPDDATVIYNLPYTDLFTSFSGDSPTDSIWSIAGVAGQVKGSSLSIGIPPFQIENGGEYEAKGVWKANPSESDIAALTVLKVKFIPNSKTLSWKANTQYTPTPSLEENLEKTFSHKMNNMTWKLDEESEKYAKLVGPNGHNILFLTNSKDAEEIVLTVTTIDTDKNNKKSSDTYTIKPVKVVQKNDLWWFNGEKPRCAYKTKSTFTLRGGNASCSWSIKKGKKKVKFVGSQTGKKITLKSIGWSKKKKDVTLLVTYKGRNIEYKTHVYTPTWARVVFKKSFTKKHKRWTYTSVLKYDLYDQFIKKITKVIPINEKWISPVINEYPNTDWKRFAPEGSDTLVGIKDYIDGYWKNSIPPPTLTKPQNKQKVQYWFGEWRVGSDKIGKGKLVKSVDWEKTKCKWQKYRGFATHGFAEKWMEKVK